MNTQDYQPTTRRREYHRYKAEAHALLIYDKKIKRKLDLRNICAGGLSGFSDYPFPIDDKVEVILLYPFFKDFVKREARIAWRREISQNAWELGLDFRSNKILLTEYAKNNPRAT